MAQQTIAEDHVIDMRHRVHTCDLDQIVGHCANLTSNQVLLAIDRLSRSGEIELVPNGRAFIP